MAAFNGEQYIAQSINSVLSQTLTDLELIIVDDGSRDRTAEIISDLQSSDSRIRYLRQENAGQAAARNRGIAMAAGELIAFLDQDDLWLAHKLEVQTKALKEADVDVVFCNGYLFGDKVAEETMSFPITHGRFPGPEMFRLLFKQNQIPMLAALVRADALRSTGVLDESPLVQNADDYDLWLRLAAEQKRFLGLPEKLVRYRIHSGQASTDNVRMLQAELAVLRRHENNRLLSRENRASRFRSMYEKLVLALVKEGRYPEARKYLKELSAIEKYSPGLLAQTVLLKVLPGHFIKIMDLANRARESVSYRITRPLQRALRSGPTP